MAWSTSTAVQFVADGQTLGLRISAAESAWRSCDLQITTVEGWPVAAFTVDRIEAAMLIRVLADYLAEFSERVPVEDP